MPTNNQPRDRYGEIDKSAPDLPDYPYEMTSDERRACYWEYIRLNGSEADPSNPPDLAVPDDWWHYLDSAQRHATRLHEKLHPKETTE